jgi:excisionase family DNA binding protein
MLTRNDLRAVLIEALQGAADGLRSQMEATPPVARPEPPVEDRVGRSDPSNSASDDPLAFGDRLLVSIPEAAKALGVSRTVAYNLISSGDLTTVTIGRRRLVPVATLKDFVKALR